MSQMTLNQHIGEQLFNLRTHRCISPEELAPYLSISLETYSAYESGLRVIPAVTLVDLSLYFEVPLIYFFEGYSLGKQRSAALINELEDLRAKQGARGRRRPSCE